MSQVCVKKETRWLVKGKQRFRRTALYEGLTSPPSALLERPGFPRLLTCPASVLDWASVCPTTGCAVSIIMGFIYVFYTSCLLKIVLVSNGGKTQGHFASSLWPLVVSWLGVLVFIQATQVQFLSRELRFLFRNTHCSLSKIMSMFFSCCGLKRHYLILFYGRITRPCVSELHLLYRHLSSWRRLLSCLGYCS